MIFYNDVQDFVSIITKILIKNKQTNKQTK